MKTNNILSGGLLAVAVTFVSSAVARDKSSDLQISRDPGTGKVTVSWNGKGVLKQSATLTRRFKPTKTRGNSHTVDAEAEQMLFQVDTVNSHVYSVNIVGYVNAMVPPGLSLMANPLLAYDNSVAALFPQAPDGAQAYKYVTGVGYEVSTYDAVAGAWSNPGMTLPPGVGFFFNSTASNAFLQTFVGEVRTGTLVLPLPAGFSTKGALIPLQGSINSVHLIPGEPGDLLRLYVNDPEEGGDYVTSLFTVADGWVPDLSLGLAQGFVSEKQNAQDWVRVFNPF